MTETEWLACGDPKPMISHILRRDAFSDRRVGLLMCACCWQLRVLLSERSHSVIELAERYSEGTLPHEELMAAWGILREIESGTLDPIVIEILADLVHDDPWGHTDRIADKTAMVLGGKAMSGVPESQEDEAYWDGLRAAEQEQIHILHDIFGNPFRPTPFSSEWQTDTALAMAQQMYDAREFSAMPILADALQDAGCDSDDILNHCRGPNPHVRGCWVVDLLLGKG